MAAEFEYWYVFLVMLAEFALAVLVLTVYLRKCRSQPYKWFETKTFENISSSCYGGDANLAIMYVRLAFFLWFIIVALIMQHSLFPNSWHYFTVWNGYLLVSYFGLAFFASFARQFGSYFEHWLTPSENFARNYSVLVGVLFEIAGSSAIFVTFVNFTLLSPRPSFMNIAMHGTTSCCQVMEHLLNNIRVEPFDLIFVLSWPVLFMLFIVPVVMLNVRGYPYDFLKTDTPMCFAWYKGLVFILIMFYSVWLGFSRLKYHLLGSARNSDESLTGLLREQRLDKKFLMT